MRKTLIKSFSILFIIFNLFTINAFASTTFKYQIGDSTFTLDKPLVVYADSSQWDYRSPYWILATPDFQQSYSNTWASVNGKWYYLDKNGHLVQNKLFTDYNSKNYFLTDDGSMLVNDYCLWQFRLMVYHAGSDGSLTQVGSVTDFH